MKHPRLQVAGLLGLLYIARVEIDRVAAIAWENAGERRGIGPCPPQRLARGQFHDQEREPNRRNQGRMPVGPYIVWQQRDTGRRRFSAQLRELLEGLRRSEFRADG